MSIQHTESSCCGAPVRHFGGRRRQCTKCLRTWRVYPHKRGREQRRKNKRLLERTLVDGQTIKQQHKLYYKNYCSLSALRKRFRSTLKSFVEKPPDHLNKLYSKNGILLADGTWYKFKNKRWTLYLFAFKPIKQSKAWLLDPVFLQGRESTKRWQKALETIPSELKQNIKAIVTDNTPTITKVVQAHQWVHQLCHFHLLSAFRRRKGSRDTTLNGRDTRQAIFENVYQFLKTKDQQKLEVLIVNLRKLSQHSDCTKKLTMMVNTLLKKKDNYQAYLAYPKLDLPCTTNTIESVVKIVKKQTKTLSTPKSVRLWSTGITRMKSFVTCNGQKKNKNQPN